MTSLLIVLECKSDDVIVVVRSAEAFICGDVVVTMVCRDGCEDEKMLEESCCLVMVVESVRR